MADKQVIEAAADYCETQAREALERGLKFSAAHGPQSCLNDFYVAGALANAAADLRKLLD